MNKYSSYKDSGVEWIGDIPNKWSKEKLKYLFDEKKSTKNPSLQCGSISFGKVIYKDDDRVPISTKESYQELLDGEFLINPLNLNYDLKSLRIGKSEINVVVSQGYIILKLNGKNIPEYFNYLLKEFDIKHMKSLGQGIRQTISYTHLKDEYLITPPIPEQQEIVSFLDDKTQKIDSLIQQKEKKIELLKEKRTSLINEVVTKGLNPNVKMKDSGVEWIGEIPNHWEYGKIKFFVNYKKGYPFKSENMSDEGLPIIKVTSVKKLKINPPKTFYNGELLDKITIVKEGDIIITTVGSKYEVSNSSVGQLGLVEKEQNEFLLNQNTVSIRTIENSIVNNVFIFMCFQSKRFRNYLDIHSHGTVNQSSLNVDDILNFNISYPSHSEQQQIVEYIDKQTEEIDTLIQLEQKKIDTLKEYRQSLISEVVTGKIRVCEEDNSLSLNPHIV